MFQCPNALVQLGMSATNIHSYAVYLNDCMLVVCSNSWAVQLSATPMDGGGVGEGKPSVCTRFGTSMGQGRNDSGCGCCERLGWQGVVVRGSGDAVASLGLARFCVLAVLAVF